MLQGQFTNKIIILHIYCLLFEKPKRFQKIPILKKCPLNYTEISFFLINIEQVFKFLLNNTIKDCYIL